MMKAMFQAEAPLEFVTQKLKRKMPPYGGVAQFIDYFETEKPHPRPPFEDPLQRRSRKRKEKIAVDSEVTEAAFAAWNPHEPANPMNGDVTSDAYKTLFVARLSYDTAQHKLRREFEQYGPIKALRIVHDVAGEARGYAFIEYEREADMKDAYKRSDGRKIDGRRVVVDVERGRTVRKWRPRRFGGGLGNTRASRVKGEKPRVITSGRVAPLSTSRPSFASQGHYGNAPSSSSSSSWTRARDGDRGREMDRGGVDRYSVAPRVGYSDGGSSRYEDRDRGSRDYDRGSGRSSRDYDNDRRRGRSRSR